MDFALHDAHSPVLQNIDPNIRPLYEPSAFIVTGAGSALFADRIDTLRVRSQAPDHASFISGVDVRSDSPRWSGRRERTHVSRKSSVRFTKRLGTTTAIRKIITDGVRSGSSAPALAATPILQAYGYDAQLVRAVVYNLRRAGEFDVPAKPVVKLPLTAGDRKFIADQRAAGVPNKEILADARFAGRPLTVMQLRHAYHNILRVSSAKKKTCPPT